MAGKIFISYRRQDSQIHSQLVLREIERAFGRNSAFMDLDLKAGHKFPEKLEQALSSCKAMVAVIGPTWLSISERYKDELGVERERRRLDNPMDWVRLEVRRALERGIPVIPVVVAGADLPAREELPVDISALVEHQGRMIGHNSVSDMAALVHDLRPYFGTWPFRLELPWGWIGTAAVSVMAIGYVGAYQLGVPVPWPWASGAQPGQPTKEKLESPARQAALKAQEAKRQADEKASDEARRAAAKKAADDETERQRVAALKDEEDRQRAAAKAKRDAQDEAARQAALKAQEVKRQADEKAADEARKKADALSRLDGSWTVMTTPISGCSYPGTTYVLKFKGGAITGRHSGTVSPSGDIRWSGIAVTVGVPITYVGKISGNLGTGRYRNANGCHGSFTIRRS